jgi:dolichyl-phosphate beta-glucosyltransferase
MKSKRNLGKGWALKLGVKKAKHDWILTTEIDMSVSLFQFLNWMKKKLIHKKYFVYFGSRTHKESIVKKNIFRNMLGNVMTFCISAVLNIKIKDTQCGYKLYKKKVARLIFSKLKNCGFEHDVELVLLLKSKQIKIRELPIKWVHKTSSSLNILWDPVKMLVGIFLLKFRKF